jgi:GT2 family glycosyltransferase
VSTDYLVRSQSNTPRSQPPSGAPAVNGRVRHACSLTKSVVVLEGMLRGDHSGADPTDGGVEALAIPAPKMVHSRGMTFVPASSRPVDDTTDGWLSFLAVARLECDDQPVLVDLDFATVLFDPDQVRLVSSEEMGWIGLSGASAEDRGRAISFVASTALGLAGESTALAHELRRFRDTARESLPQCEIHTDKSEGLHVDSMHRVGSLGFYVRGWLRTDRGAPDRLTAVAPEGTRTELCGNIVRFPRPDVDEFYGDDPIAATAAPKGFLAYFETPTPSILAEGWILEMAGAGDDQAVEFRAAPVLVDHPTLKTMVLNDMANIAETEPAFVVDHAFPCLSALQDHAFRKGAVTSVTDHGHLPTEPTVSVIVPLYGRIDFLEHQLAQFVDDPDMATAELVYVLDSPELADQLAAIAAPLYRLYGVPFRTVVVAQNLGFAGANAVGAATANAPKILLMNSDVLPAGPGWLSRLASFLDETANAGAVGPKLIFEDGTIQHAGMYFHRDEGCHSWENIHYYKGLDGAFPPANRERRVPALTGACLLMGRDLWDRIGGFKGIYVQGDFEDSDICLRIAEFGYDCWYVPEVELYHLEGQSYPSSLRRLASRFNAWLHTHLWDDRITDLMTRFGEAAPTQTHRKDQQ